MPTGLNAGSAYVSVRVDTSKFTKELGAGIKPALASAEKTAGGAMAGVMGVAGKIAKVGSVAIAAGAVAAIGSIGKMGMEYQNSLNIFQAATSATAAQMDKVKVAARELGNDITLPGLSAKDAAGAMTELAKGGLSVEQSMQAAKGTLQLATAAQIDGAQAAEIQANALAMFGLKASDAGHVADVLANTANAASGEITDFALAMKYVGPVAAGLGISIDDVSTSMGVLANNGIKGEAAGTALRSMMASMAAPSKQAAGAMKALGINAFDSSGKFVGMRTVISQLTAAQGKMTDQQFTSNASMAFGATAISAVTAVAGQGPKAFDAMAKAVGKQGGAADLAAAKSKGLAGAIDSMKSTLETAGLALYDKVAPGVEKAVRGITEAMPGALDTVGTFFTGLFDGFSGFASSPAVASVGSTVTTMVDKFTTAFSSIVDSSTFTSITDSIQRIADVVKGPLSEGWTNIQPVLEAVGTVLGTTLGMAIDTVKGSLDALADAVEFIDRNFNTIKTTLEVAAVTLGVVFLPQLVAVTAGLVANGLAAVVSAGETAILWTMYKVDAVFALGATIAKSWAMVAAFVAQGAAAVASAAETAVLWVMYKVEAISSLGGAIAAMGRMALSYAATATAAVLSAGQTAVIWTMYKVEAIKSMAAAVLSMGRTAAGFVATGLAAAGSAIAMGASSAASYVMAAAQWVLNSAFLACPITWIVLGIIALVAAIIYAYKNSETFRNIVQAVWAAIKTAVAAVLDWFVNVLWPGIKAVWDGIVTALKFVWTFASGFVKGYIGIYVWLWNRLVQIVTAIKNAVVTAFKWIWTVVVPAVSNGIRSIVAFFTGLWTRYVTIVGQIRSALVGAFKGMWDTIVSTVSTAVGRVVQFVVGIKSKITGAFVGAGSWLLDAGEKIISGIVSGMDSVKNWIRDKIAELKKLIPDWAQKAMGMASPAKIMIPIGRGIGAGLAAGIESSNALVEKAVGGLAGAARTAIGPVTVPVVAAAGGGYGGPAGGGPMRHLQQAAAVHQAAPAVQVTVNGALDPNAVGRQVVELLRREGRFRTAPVLAG